MARGPVAAGPIRQAFPSRRQRFGIDALAKAARLQADGWEVAPEAKYTRAESPGVEIRRGFQSGPDGPNLQAQICGPEPECANHARRVPRRSARPAVAVAERLRAAVTAFAAARTAAGRRVPAHRGRRMLRWRP